MFYLIYKITSKMDGKVYIGSHKTKNIDDGYMGSGKYLNYAYKKHGIENFIKEILFLFDNANDMYAKEAEIVNKDFLAEENTYNLKKGGFGGFDYINASGKNLYGSNGKTPNIKADLAKSRQAQKKRRAENPEYTKKINEKISQSLKGRTGSFKNKKHKAETKKIIGEKSSIYQKGNKNSQFGTCWVTHGEFGNKKIDKDDLEKFVALGYIKGRKIKK